MSSPKRFFLALFSFFSLSGVSHAAYTPLIASTDFDGIRTDVTTTAVGIISVLVIIVGVSLIARAFTR